MIQVHVATMKIPYQATSSVQKGDRLILEYATSGDAQTSPNEGCYAVRYIWGIGWQSTHYWPTLGLRVMPFERLYSWHS